MVTQMTTPQTTIRLDEKPTLIDRLLSFLIVSLAFVVLDRLFEFFFPTWHKSFSWSAFSGSVFAVLIALFRPQLTTPLSRWAQRPFLKNKPH